MSPPKSRTRKIVLLIMTGMLTYILVYTFISNNKFLYFSKINVFVQKCIVFSFRLQISLIRLQSLFFTA
jgi:hypothetical protein